jgi:hypothetical protein
MIVAPLVGIVRFSVESGDAHRRHLSEYRCV